MTARPRQRRRPAAGNSESSVDRIRETALRIFAERGYHATSVRDITAASGVVPAALYNHFQSKADLLQDLILRGHDEIDKRVEAVLAAPGLAPAERLARITRELARFHAEQTDLATLSNREFRALPEPQLQAIIAQRRRLRGRLEDVITDGLAEGAFRVPVIDGKPAVTLAAMSILNALVHIADWYRPGREYSPDQVADFYAEWAAASLAQRVPSSGSDRTTTMSSPIVSA